MANLEESCHETCYVTPEDRERFQDRHLPQEHYQEMRCAECLNEHDKEVDSKQISGWRIAIYGHLKDLLIIVLFPHVR